LKILRSCRKTRIKIRVLIIFGFPGETKEEAEKTLAFLLKNKELYDSLALQPFRLEKNTELFQFGQKQGLLKWIDKRDRKRGLGTRFGYDYEPVAGMTQAETERFMEHAMASFKKDKNLIILRPPFNDGTFIIEKRSKRALDGARSLE